MLTYQAPPQPASEIASFCGMSQCIEAAPFSAHQNQFCVSPEARLKCHEGHASGAVFNANALPVDLGAQASIVIDFQNKKFMWDDDESDTVFIRNSDGSKSALYPSGYNHNTYNREGNKLQRVVSRPTSYMRASNGNWLNHQGEAPLTFGSDGVVSGAIGLEGGVINELGRLMRLVNHYKYSPFRGGVKYYDPVYKHRIQGDKTFFFF